MTSWPPCAIFWAANIPAGPAPTTKTVFTRVPPALRSIKSSIGITQRRSRNELNCGQFSLLSLRDFADGYITIKRLKGSLNTTHPLFKADEPLLDVRRAVAAWLKEIPKGGLLFPITRQHFHRLFQGYCKEAGIPKPLPHPHTLKHSVAMELVKKVGIQDLRQFIGHKSLNSTGMYLRVSNQEASAAVAKAMDF